MGEQPESYDSAILHDPVDVDPEGPIAQVMQLLDKTLRIYLKDGRIYEGSFVFFDRFGSFVLNEAEETFLGRKASLDAACIPFDYVEKIELIGPGNGAPAPV